VRDHFKFRVRVTQTSCKIISNVMQDYKKMSCESDVAEEEQCVKEMLRERDTGNEINNM